MITARLRGLVRIPLGAFPKGRRAKRIYKRAVNIAVLINVAILFVFINPFAQGANAAAVPITPYQLVAEGAEEAALVLLEKEGYKIAESTAAKAVVKSMYSRLSPAGKQYFDDALAAATQADKSPYWLKAIIPTALIAEIGGIMASLNADDDAGTSIPYNDESGANTGVTIAVGMPETTIWTGQARIVGPFQAGPYSDTNHNYTYYWENMVKNYKSLQSVPFDTAGYIWKITVQWVGTSLTNFPTSYGSFKVWYKDPSVSSGSYTYSYGGQGYTLDQLDQILNAMGVMVSYAVSPGISQDSTAVTSDPSTVPTDPIEIAYPKNDGVQSFDSLNQDLQDPTKVDQVTSPTTLEPTVPSTTSPTTDWWKWLLAPLEKILELLQQIWSTIQQWWSTLSGWWSQLLSKLADLLGAWSTWFGQLFDKLGAWFTDLFNKLGTWLDPLGQWFQDVIGAIEALPQGLADFFKDLGADIAGLPDAIGNWLMDHVVGDPNNVQYDKLKQTGEFFTTKFPFSLPWDIEKALHAVFGQFSSHGAPEWQFTLDGYSFTIKFPDMVISWAPFIRNVILITFDISLIYSVRKLLGGAQ